MHFTLEKSLQDKPKSSTTLLPLCCVGALPVLDDCRFTEQFQGEELTWGLLLHLAGIL